MFPFENRFYRTFRPSPFSYFFDDFLGPPPFPGSFGIPRPPYLNVRFRVGRKPQKQQAQVEKSSIFDSVTKPITQFNKNQGQYWSCLGTAALKNGDYPLAIQHFNKAIEISEESSFYRYRATAFKKNGNLQPALKDAVTAIELDEHNIKAHLLCGQICAEIGKTSEGTNDIETAIKRLTKARTLCSGQKKQHYEDELSTYIYRAKKLLWYKSQEIINKNKKQEIEEFKQELQKKEGISQENKEKELQLFIRTIGNPDEPMKLEIPSYLLCSITQEIMEDPVITSAGQTYERDALMKAVKSNGLMDPITREKISPDVYKNVAVRLAAQDFLLNNPWAFEFTPGENFVDIQF